LLLFITEGSTYVKAVCGGGSEVIIRGCYEPRPVWESDHHALMYVWHGQTGREEGVGEASANCVIWEGCLCWPVAGEDSGKCVCGVYVGRLAAIGALSKIEDIYSDTP